MRVVGEGEKGKAQEQSSYNCRYDGDDLKGHCCEVWFKIKDQSCRAANVKQKNSML